MYKDVKNLKFTSNHSQSQQDKSSYPQNSKLNYEKYGISLMLDYNYAENKSKINGSRLIFFNSKKKGKKSGKDLA